MRGCPASRPGIKLEQAGIRDYVIVEKADGVGGTWRDNVYPGLAVDIPTLTYSYSFEQNPDWSNLYAPGPELRQYADHCTDKYGVRPHVRFGETVAKAVYDEAGNIWAVHLESGEVLTARYLVSATGYLQVAKMPEIEGIESFEGTLLHSAKWDLEHDLSRGAGGGDRHGCFGNSAHSGGSPSCREPRRVSANANLAPPEIGPARQRPDEMGHAPHPGLPVGVAPADVAGDGPPDGERSQELRALRVARQQGGERVHGITSASRWTIPCCRRS